MLLLSISLYAIRSITDVVSYLNFIVLVTEGNARQKQGFAANVFSCHSYCGRVHLGEKRCKLLQGLPDKCVNTPFEKVSKLEYFQGLKAAQLNRALDNFSPLNCH